MSLFLLGLMLLLQTGPEPTALGEGAKIRVAGRDYSLRFFDKTTIGNVERSDKLCLWKDGTAWVIDPFHPGLTDHFACPWPITTLSEDRSLAIVELPGRKDLRVGVADLRKKVLVAEFPDEEYLGGTSRWIFSKRQHVYALDGATIGGWHYIDLAQKKCVHVKIPGFTIRRDTYSWGGALLPGGKKVVLFLSGIYRSDGSRRVQFPVDEFERRQIAIPENSLTMPIMPMAAEMQLFCTSGKYSIVSTSTWKLLKEIDWGSERSIPTTMLLGPGKRNAYLMDYPEGLIVFEPQSGKLVEKVPEATPTRQVTFTSDGRHCVVCTEKPGIAVLDTLDQKVVCRAALKRQAIMAFLIVPSGKDAVGTCLLLPATSLDQKGQP